MLEFAYMLPLILAALITSMGKKSILIGVYLVGVYFLMAFLPTAYLFLITEGRPFWLLLLSIFYLALTIGMFKRSRAMWIFLLIFAAVRIGIAFIFSFLYIFSFSSDESITPLPLEIIYIAEWGFMIYFFTRPKVTEQFK